MTRKISGSQPGAVSSPQVHLAMSGMLSAVTVGDRGTEARDAAERPMVHGIPTDPLQWGVPTKNGLAHMSVEQCPSSPASPLTPRAPNGGTPTSAFLTELPRRSRTCDPGKLKPRLFLHGHPGRGGQGRGASISRCQLTNFSRSPERKVLLGPQSPLPHLPTDAVTHS